MSLFFEFVSMIGVIAIVIILFEIRNDLKHLKRLKQSGSVESVAAVKPRFFAGSSFRLSENEMGSPTGHAIFVFVNGGWRLQEDFSKPGFEATPPGMLGAYEGHVIRTESSLPGSKSH